MAAGELRGNVFLLKRRLASPSETPERSSVLAREACNATLASGWVSLGQSSVEGGDTLLIAAGYQLLLHLG